MYVRTRHNYIPSTQNRAWQGISTQIFTEWMNFHISTTMAVLFLGETIWKWIILLVKIITKWTEGWQNCFPNWPRAPYLHQHCQHIWIQPIRGKNDPTPSVPTPRPKLFLERKCIVWVVLIASFQHKNVLCIIYLPWKYLLYITIHHQIDGNTGFCGSTWKQSYSFCCPDRCINLSNPSPH